MPAIEAYDVLILGSGEAGKYLAWSLGGAGARTAVVERRYVGGSCPNIACLPSKNVIHSAQIANYFRRADELGMRVASWSVDMEKVRARKRKMVDDQIAGHLDRYEKSGTDLIMGNGRFVAERTIEVTLEAGGTRVLKGENVIISTGSRAAIHEIPGLVDARPMTHIDALELGVVPDHVLVLGGGYIGLEFAQAMRRFGSKVSVVERSNRLLRHEDPDVSAALGELFSDEGIDVRTNMTVNRVSGVSGERVTLHGEQNGAAIALEGSHILVATGRTPNTEGIGLEVAGIEIGPHGFVSVNERLETTAEKVWAVGDCAGSPHFTHVAHDDFRIVRDNLAGGNRTTRGRQVPFCLFTDPELARIGLSETEAKEQGIAYRLAKIPTGVILRTKTLSEGRGLVKALIDVSSDRILGFTMFGVSAGEVMGTVQVAIAAGIPYTALRDAVLTHPTMTEGLIPLFLTVPPREG
jgi:pyruvate/2-oxoglutarate dehydrogenase complex dihydrolipoamide dehydrogenase (E3) component